MANNLLRGLFLLFSLFTLAETAAQTDEKIATDLEFYIQKAIVDWQTPGLAVAVVKDGKIILSKGFGVRELGQSARVDGQTIFACASTTKAMTALALGILVDEKKLNWTDKVVQHLPDFKINDPFVTNELTVQDLLTHNGGMGNADFLWGWSDLTSADILKKFQLAKPAYSLRGGYTYQNIMYLVAGEVVAKLSGMPWETFVQKRIFDPLSMKRTFPTLRQSNGEKNRSTPHDFISQKLSVIENCSADAISPAGSVWSCADDMSKWLQFWLDSAKINGKPLVRAETLADLWQPHALVPLSGFYPTATLTKPNWMTYGLGWFQHDYRGEKVNFHTGSLDGTVAICGLIPSERIGVYVFGNRDHTEVRHAIMYRVFDIFLNKKEGKTADLRDWSGEFKKMYDGFKATSDSATAQKDKLRVLKTTPTLPFEKYAGKYTDPLLGDALVTLKYGKLTILFSSQLSAVLEHWHYDTFKAAYNKAWFSPELYTFQLDADGVVKELRSGGAVWKKK
jgi:CubicO group peptidase (beta-lactamase class C family)